jgi:hypothetical protein
MGRGRAIAASTDPDDKRAPLVLTTASGQHLAGRKGTSMRQARLGPFVGVLVAVALWASGAPRVAAQTTAPPEGWVVLPLDEYKALREKALPAAAVSPPPPVDATLTRVDYDLRVDGETITGRARLTIDVLRDVWTRVQIPSGLLVRDARLDGQPVSLVGGSSPHVLLSRAGRFVLALELALPLTASNGSESIALPPSPSPISTATLTLPRSEVDVSVNGGFVTERTEAGTDSRWTVLGRSNTALALSWKRKVVDRRSEQPLRVRARVTQTVALGEESGQVAASVRVEVLQGLARELSLSIPTGLVVNEVNGATVGDWEVTSGVLRVRLLDPSASDSSFVISGEMRAPRDGAIAIPLVRMPSAERETGAVAVDVVGAGEIAEKQVRGLEPADPSELGDLVAGRESPSMAAFRMRPLAGTDARSITVKVVRYTPQAVLVANVEEARYRTLVSEDGKLLVEARYAVRNNQRSFLKVVMPAGSTLWSADIGGRPVRPAMAEAGAILLPLEKGRAGPAGEEAPTFVVGLVYFQGADRSAWLEKGRTRVDLPALDLPISRTGVELFYPPRFHVDPQAGPFRVEADPGPFAEALRQPVAPPAALDKSMQGDRGAAGLQALVDRFRNESGGRSVVGSLPVHVSFPAFGPSIFLASELTAEAGAPCIELVYRRTK